MKHLDLFSGIGGFALACQWNSIETIGFVEIDKYCQKVLKKHWSDVPIVEDIRDVKEDTFPKPVGLITGGYPCQPFSVAGRRGGKGDDRYLWPEMLRVVQAFRPTWVLGENVPGIIDMELDTALSDLEGIGYSTQAFVIPACSINAPHRRDRVWIVAYSKGINEQGGIIRESKGKQPQVQFGGFFGDFGRGDRIYDLPTPYICRKDDGIPNRVDRLKCLGNAIVPQVAYEIIKVIKGVDERL